MMSKGIIVVDKPEKCNECNFWFAKATDPVEYRCMAKQKKLKSIKEKPDWCPIRLMPDKLVEIDSPHSMGDFERKGFQRGWNEIRNKILKEDKG